jgi:HPt (histidine-containing phosphotransfer) domain-containing protein
MVQMTEEFIESFDERLASIEFSLKLIYSHPISETFTDQVARDLHLISHSLAGVAENYGFTNLGRLAARVEKEILQAIDCPMGSVAVANVIRAAKELEQTLRLARETTSFEESPASEATP